MFKAFFSSHDPTHRSRAYFGAGLLFAFLILQNLNALAFNVLNGDLLDALAHASERPESVLWYAVGLFSVVAVIDIVLGTTAGYANSLYSIVWRQVLTKHYVPRWESCTTRIEGASQRIQEDPGMFADIVESMSLDFFRSVLALFSFAPLLWILGRHIRSGPLAWPGSLVAVAFAVSLVGIGISWRIGRPLKPLQIEKQVLEAAFRKHLVHAEERRQLLRAGLGWETLFDKVVRNSKRLCWSYYGFAVWATTYDKVMMLIPYAACLHNMATGALQLGVAMQIVNAFGQVQGGFSYVLKNWMRVTQLRSVHTRLREFESALAMPTCDTVSPHPALLPLTVNHG